MVFLRFLNIAEDHFSGGRPGASSIVAPDAAQLAIADDRGEALIYASICPGQYAGSREQNPYLAGLQGHPLGL